jgi:hypothetical protein
MLFAFCSTQLILSVFLQWMSQPLRKIQARWLSHGYIFLCINGLLCVVLTPTLHIDTTDNSNFYKFWGISRIQWFFECKLLSKNISEKTISFNMSRFQQICVISGFEKYEFYAHVSECAQNDMMKKNVWYLVKLCI